MFDLVVLGVFVGYYICHNLTPSTLIVGSDYSSHSSCNNYKIGLTVLEYKIKLHSLHFS